MGKELGMGCSALDVPCKEMAQYSTALQSSSIITVQ